MKIILIVILKYLNAASYALGKLETSPHYRKAVDDIINAIKKDFDM